MLRLSHFAHPCRENIQRCSRTAVYEQQNEVQSLRDIKGKKTIIKHYKTDHLSFVDTLVEGLCVK